MQVPNSYADGERAYYDAQRQRSLQAYEQQRGLPAGEPLLARLYRRLVQAVRRPAREPALTWQRKSPTGALES